MPRGNKKITHTYTKLQLKAVDMFKYVTLICYHHALKELIFAENVMRHAVIKKHCSIFPIF